MNPDDRLHGARLLAVETSTDVCSVALAIQGRVWWRHEHAPRQHAQLVLQFVDQVLTDAGVSLDQLEALVCGRGPGSFTGVRIAVSVVQGLAFGAGLPVAPVSTLATIAQGMRRVRRQDAVCVALDARMSEIYCGAYQADAAGLMRPCAAERVCPMSALDLPAGEWLAAGGGFQSYETEVPAGARARIVRTETDALPDARDALLLGQALVDEGALVAAAALEPIYLRNKVTR